MEFIDLGGFCDLCKRQDFLPIKCNNCNKIFCKDHASLDNHNCTDNNKIKIKKKTTSVYKESCSYSNCKKKEMIKFICRDCDKNYCINHRFPETHNCKKKKLVNNKKNNKKDNQIKHSDQTGNKFNCNCIIC